MCIGKKLCMSLQGLFMTQHPGTIATALHFRAQVDVAMIKSADKSA